MHCELLTKEENIQKMEVLLNREFRDKSSFGSIHRPFEQISVQKIFTTDA